MLVVVVHKAKLRCYLQDVALCVERSSVKEGIPVSGFFFTFCCQQLCLLFAVELGAEEKCQPCSCESGMMPGQDSSQSVDLHRDA